jgi:hypothetical protein
MNRSNSPLTSDASALAAAWDGDFERLVSLLHPDAVVRADFGPAGGSREVRGAPDLPGPLVSSQLPRWSASLIRC